MAGLAVIVACVATTVVTKPGCVSLITVAASEWLSLVGQRDASLRMSSTGVDAEWDDENSTIHSQLF